MKKAGDETRMIIRKLLSNGKDEVMILSLPEPGEEMAKIEILIGIKPNEELPGGDQTCVSVFYNGERLENLTHFAFTADIDSIPSMSIRKRVP